MRTIDTEQWAERYRRLAIDVTSQRTLITNFVGTEQQVDFSDPCNCKGFGRVRHFRRGDGVAWPDDPLPIVPAERALGLESHEMLTAQVFQTAVCNWRCWYCFVPFALLNANARHARWLSARDLVDLYESEEQPPRVIDLSGGQPDLTPEWVPWIMAELCRRGLDRRVYLWSDDNLSCDYYWRHLTPEQRTLVGQFKNYGRVCCFKGFDSCSFAFNTSAHPSFFDRQFVLFEKLLASGLDLYAYVTLTTERGTDIPGRMRCFMDRLQHLDENLPLRTVPLEIRAFTPVRARMGEEHRLALRLQYDAVHVWRDELDKRFTSRLRRTRICDVPLNRGGG